jgi:hypothetical protein
MWFSAAVYKWKLNYFSRKEYGNVKNAGKMLQCLIAAG